MWHQAGTAGPGFDYSTPGFSISYTDIGGQIVETITDEPFPLAFAAGAATATLTLSTIDDTHIEGLESFALFVLPDSSYTVAPQSLADAVILDDDAASAALTGFLLI